MVTSVEKDYLYAKKFVGSQFRSKCYKLLYSDIYPVPTTIEPRLPPPHYQSDRSESSDDPQPPRGARPPVIREPAPLITAVSPTSKAEDAFPLHLPLAMDIPYL